MTPAQLELSRRLTPLIKSSDLDPETVLTPDGWLLDLSDWMTAAGLLRLAMESHIGVRVSPNGHWLFGAEVPCDCQRAKDTCELGTVAAQVLLAVLEPS